MELTPEVAHVGMEVICRTNPDWGTWTLGQDRNGWTLTAPQGCRMLDEGEFHFWDVVVPAHLIERAQELGRQWAAAWRRNMRQEAFATTDQLRAFRRSYSMYAAEIEAAYNTAKDA